MDKFQIKNDVLIRREPAYTCEGGMSYVKETAIITKEEFIACYNAWITSDLTKGGAE